MQLKNKNWFFLFGIVLIIVLFVGFQYFQDKQASFNISKTTITSEQYSVVSLKDFNKYEAEKNPKIPEYSLPLKTSDIVNLGDIKSILNISKSANSLLLQNGFVVVPNTVFKDIKLGSGEERGVSTRFDRYYEYLHDKIKTFTQYGSDRDTRPTITKHLPVFISTDSILHYFHLMFDTTLIRLETDVFYDNVWDISKELLDKSLAEYNTTTDPIIKEAAKRNVAYFSVALNLLKPQNTQSIYDNPLYLNNMNWFGNSLYSNNMNWFMVSSCLDQEHTEIRYQDVIDTLMRVLRGSKDEQEKYVDLSHVGDNSEPETNLNKIINAVFKYYGLNSAEDIAKMKQIQKACETAIIQQMQTSQPLDLVDTSKYQFETPSFVKNIVDQELTNIGDHKGWAYSPLFIYKEDYSQYIPRGHYTKSEKLKQYFKAMTWYGRMTFLVKGDSKLKNNISKCTNNGIISQYDAKIQTTGSLLINWYLLNDSNLQNKLTNIIDSTDFFVGGSDDFGSKEYMQIVAQYVKQPIDITKKFNLIQKDILSIPNKTKIYSGLGECEMDVSKNIQLTVQAQDMLNATKGFRLLGQKFVIDSYWMSQVVSPYSGEYTGGDKKPFTWVQNAVTGRGVRGFPRGLDVMSILGSKRAGEIIQNIGDANYTDYTKQINNYKQEIQKFTLNDWYKTIYNAWLYSLTALLDNFVKGYPTFMLTKAYQDKSLTTALSSWTQLRHDTLLYVKQSYSMAERGGFGEEPVIVGYVEPVPELYIRLYQTSLIFQDKLNKLIFLDDVKNNTEEDIEGSFLSNTQSNFEELNEILGKLITISNKELRYEALTEDEYDFIDNFDSTSHWLIIRLVSNMHGGDIIDIGDLFDTILVTDVHTDGNTNQVLEEGVGKIRTGLFVYRTPQNNNLVLGVGPVFSYYEFLQPINNRLTDEEWKKMLLEQNKQPDKPEWLSSFYTKD